MTSLLLRALHFAGFGAVEQVLRHRSFRFYLIGHIPNVIGVWVVRVAIGWLGWQLTGSAFWLGALAAADSMPALVLGPFGGVMADRHDRRKISIATQASLAIIAVLLTVLTVSDLMTIWLLFALALGRGIGHGRGGPSIHRQALDSGGEAEGYLALPHLRKGNRIPAPAIPSSDLRIS